MTVPSTRIGIVSTLLACLVFTGCQGTGSTQNFIPQALSVKPQTMTSKTDNLTILVESFQDARPEQNRLGVRTHLWGGVTHFNVWDGEISEGMAKMAVDYLQQHQWQASRATTAMDNENSPSDVILTGSILSLQANAKSGFGFTDITIDMRVRFEAKNLKDGSSVRMVLGATGQDTVGAFSLSDVERLFNLVAKDLYAQLFRDLKVQDQAFHLATPAHP